MYDRKLKYDQFKNFVKSQDPKYFDENPQFFLLFKDQLEQNKIDALVKNNTGVYQKWMGEFEEYKQQSENEGKEANMQDFFEQLYTKNRQIEALS